MRIEAIEKDTTEPGAASTFERARAVFGWLPNTIRVMARGSSAAGIYLTAVELNAEGSLSAVERELVAVLTATHNGCEYCLRAHSLAARALGVPDEEVRAAGRGHSPRPRRKAILRFAEALLLERGRLEDAELEQAREAGIDQTAQIDIVAVVAENTLGNLVNNLAETALDPTLDRTAGRMRPAGAGKARERVAR